MEAKQLRVFIDYNDHPDAAGARQVCCNDEMWPFVTVVPLEMLIGKVIKVAEVNEVGRLVLILADPS